MTRMQREVSFAIACVITAVALFLLFSNDKNRATVVEPITYVDVKPMCGVKRGKDVIAFQCELVNGEWRKLP